MVLPSWATTPSAPYVAVSVRDVLFSFFAMEGSYKGYPNPRNLQKRRDIREKAWQNDGWAETVSKARIPMSSRGITLLTLDSPDGAAGTDNGCIYFDAAVIQSSEVRSIRVYTIIPS